MTLTTTVLNKYNTPLISILRLLAPKDLKSFDFDLVLTGIKVTIIFVRDTGVSFGI